MVEESAVIARIAAGLEALQGIVKETREDMKAFATVLNIVQGQVNGIRQEVNTLARDLDNLIKLTRGEYNGGGGLIARIRDLEAKIKHLCDQVQGWQSTAAQEGEHHWRLGIGFMQGFFALLAALLAGALGYWLRK